MESLYSDRVMRMPAGPKHPPAAAAANRAAIPIGFNIRCPILNAFSVAYECAGLQVGRREARHASLKLMRSHSPIQRRQRPVSSAEKCAAEENFSSGPRPARRGVCWVYQLLL